MLIYFFLKLTITNHSSYAKHMVSITFNLHKNLMRWGLFYGHIIDIEIWAQKG